MTKRILLVEDNPADEKLTLRAFKQAGVVNEVTVVRDGAEALDFVFCRGLYAERRFDRPPKLILLDLKLPKVSGHQVLRAIKSDPRTRSIPVVVLTSSAQDRDLVECYRSGTNSYIQKPVNFVEFQEVVHKLGFYWLVLNHRPPVGAYSVA